VPSLLASFLQADQQGLRLVPSSTTSASADVVATAPVSGSSTLLLYTSMAFFRRRASTWFSFLRRSISLTCFVTILAWTQYLSGLMLMCMLARSIRTPSSWQWFASWNTLIVSRVHSLGRLADYQVRSHRELDQARAQPKSPLAFCCSWERQFFVSFLSFFVLTVCSCFIFLWFYFLCVAFIFTCFSYTFCGIVLGGSKTGSSTLFACDLCVFLT